MNEFIHPLSHWFQQLLVDLELCSLPNCEESWPVYVNTAPPVDDAPANYVVLIDAAPAVFSRSLRTGKYMLKDNVQIQVRAEHPHIGIDKSLRIFQGLNQVLNQEIVMDSETLQFLNPAQFSRPDIGQAAITFKDPVDPDFAQTFYEIAEGIWASNVADLSGPRVILNGNEWMALKGADTIVFTTDVISEDNPSHGNWNDFAEHVFLHFPHHGLIEVLATNQDLEALSGTYQWDGFRWSLLGDFFFEIGPETLPVLTSISGDPDGIYFVSTGNSVEEPWNLVWTPWGSEGAGELILSFKTFEESFQGASNPLNPKLKILRIHSEAGITPMGLDESRNRHLFIINTLTTKE